MVGCEAFLYLIFLSISVMCAFDEMDKVTHGSALKLLHKPSGHRLHSHEISWGSGSGQQSVTAVKEDSDTNSLWSISGSLQQGYVASGTPVKCGDTIRLKHSRTGKFLHSHLHVSPLSRNQEVSCYDGGDTGDDWKIQCEGEFWQRKSSVYLVHADTGTFLATEKNFEFNQMNCRNCPIRGQLEVHTRKSQSDQSEWVTAEGIYFPVSDEIGHAVL